jgi:hypothetical protein
MSLCVSWGSNFNKFQKTDGWFLLLVVVEGKVWKPECAQYPRPSRLLQEPEPEVLFKSGEGDRVEGEEGERRTSQRTALYPSATRQELLLL